MSAISKCPLWPFVLRGLLSTLSIVHAPRKREEKEREKKSGKEDALGYKMYPAVLWDTGP